MRILVLERGADDDHQNTERTDGRRSHQHWPSSSFVNKAYSDQGTKSHNRRLEGVHQKLSFGGENSCVLGHQRHVVRGWWEIDLTKESDTEDEEHAVSGTTSIEQLSVIVPALVLSVHHNELYIDRLNVLYHCHWWLWRLSFPPSRLGQSRDLDLPRHGIF